MTNLITLTTDFGLTDGFVGVMKGVILSINPEALCLDITHNIARQDIQQGAFLLANSVPYFPAAAIHVCVVDPGVGSTRRPIAVQVAEAIFVGPDNGVLSLAIEAQRSRAPDAKPLAFHLNNPRYWLPRISTTFHGRDIFSPCAAHLSLGVPLEEMGAPVDDWTSLTPSKPIRRKDGSLLGHVIYIDRYGNIVSDISEEALREFGTRDLKVEIAGREIHGLVRAYSDVEPEEFAALIGSPWKLEIAQREASAAEALGVCVGDEVVVRHSREE
jgi:S-adenosyl-L-methionine hydrolase (adenosine-forming)